MRFRIRKPGKPRACPEARAALARAEAALAQAQDRRPEAEALGRWLRRVREANHFAENITVIPAEGRGRHGR
jgi:hypothetical protein